MVRIIIIISTSKKVKAIINEVTHIQFRVAMLRFYILVPISATCVCAIMLPLSYVGRIHMCELCKSQKGPAGGGRDDSSVQFDCEAPRESYLKSHHSRLHSVKSSWLRLQALAVVSLGTLVITEVGHGIGDVYCDFADTCCLSLSTRLSAVSVSLCFHSQAWWPPALTG